MVGTWVVAEITMKAAGVDIDMVDPALRALPKPAGKRCAKIFGTGHRCNVPCLKQACNCPHPSVGSHDAKIADRLPISLLRQPAWSA
jgi:hypothetical protein